MAAVVKGSVEEMLPFHADHQWGCDPLQIGELFSVVAIAYIFAAMGTGQIWQLLHPWHVIFSAAWLALLGATSWAIFIVSTYSSRTIVLGLGLVAYGICLGLTHTPAALLLASAVEHEREQASKDAVNGIYNTMWEAGGSLGFLLGGLLAEDWGDQINLMTGFAVCSTIAASGMLIVGKTRCDEPKSPVFLDPIVSPLTFTSTYASTMDKFSDTSTDYGSLKATSGC